MSDPYLLAVCGHCYTMSCLLKGDSPNWTVPDFYIIDYIEVLRFGCIVSVGLIGRGLFFVVALSF